MRALPWVLVSVIIAIVLLIVAIVIGGAWLNSYIHSDAFKHEVETRAGQTLGGTVQIEKIDFSLTEGVELQGVVTQIDPQHANGQGALLVRAGSVNCSYDWMELFGHTLKLNGIAFKQPQIILTRQATAPASALPANASSPKTGSPGQPGASTPFQFILDWVKINDGTFSLRNEDGNSTIDLQGLNVYANTASFSSGGDVTGNIRIAKVGFVSGLRGTDFFTPFTYHQGTLLAKPLQATSFGGSLAGDYQLGVGPSILNLNAKGVDVAQFTNALASQSTAKLSGSLDWQSKWRNAETGALDGEGDAQLSGGKLSDVKMLQDLSNILKVKELYAPDISKAQTHFMVQNRQTQFTGLQLQSTIFNMTGDGTIGFDGGLNANLVLILTRDAMSKLPKEVASSFVQAQNGTGSIQFHVTGTISNPQTDLMQRLLLQNTQTQIQNVLNKQLNKFFNKKSNSPPDSDPNQNQSQPNNSLLNFLPGQGH